MNIRKEIISRAHYYALIILIVLVWAAIFSNAQCQVRGKRKAIHYDDLRHNHRWGTFVEASDTIYFNGCLVVFDTVNLVYKTVAHVKVIRN